MYSAKPVIFQQPASREKRANVAPDQPSPDLAPVGIGLALGRGIPRWDLQTTRRTRAGGDTSGNLAARGDGNRADDVIAAHERHLVEEI